MASANSLPFGTTDFADNPEPRCPCVLLLDVSGSMRGAPIVELNAGLAAFKRQLLADGLAAKRVEVSVITFGPVTIVSEFETAEHFTPPTLKAEGDTPIGRAIEAALEQLRQRKEAYRANGIAFYRPWIFLITDGGPTDHWQDVANEIAWGETAKSFSFYAVGVGDAHMDILRLIAVREPLYLRGLDFAGLFQWLSNSMASVSRSSPGMEVSLVDPTGPGGWASK